MLSPNTADLRAKLDAVTQIYLVSYGSSFKSDQVSLHGLSKLSYQK